MTLKAKIDEYKEGMRARVPREYQEIMNRAIEELQNSAQMREVVKVGDAAPDFRLKNTDGTDVVLSALLARGPVVLNFYRGRW